MFGDEFRRYIEKDVMKKSRTRTRNLWAPSVSP